MAPPTLRLEAAPVNWLGGAETEPVPDGEAVPEGLDPPMTGEDGTPVPTGTEGTAGTVG